MNIQDLPVNKNGRVYPPDVLRRAVERAQPNIDAGRMFGELENPVDGRTRMANVSHAVRGMKMNRDGSIIAKIEVLDTEAGRMLKAMLDAGVVSASMRGLGTVKDGVVGDDFELTTFDVSMAPPDPFRSAVDQLADIVAEDEDDS